MQSGCPSVLHNCRSGAEDNAEWSGECRSLITLIVTFLFVIFFVLLAEVLVVLVLAHAAEEEWGKVDKDEEPAGTDLNKEVLGTLWLVVHACFSRFAIVSHESHHVHSDAEDGVWDGDVPVDHKVHVKEGYNEESGHSEP